MKAKRLKISHLTLLGLSCTALAQDKIVTVDGSSTVFPVTEAVSEEFQNTVRGVKVTVGISGTGGGFKKFCRGETDVSNASRPISESEMKAAAENAVEYIELPICFDALTVVVNPKNTWLNSISVADLKRIWEPEAQEKILTWNQIRSEWPNEKFQLFGAGADSGTFDYFTEAICGKAKASRGDYTGSEDDHVIVRGIEGSRTAMGFVPYSYYMASKDKLKALAIDWDQDKLGAIEPNIENVRNGTYNPLSRPLFIYVNKKAYETKSHVKQFADFYLSNVSELAAEVNYLPLPDAIYPSVRERLEKMLVGSAFGGHAAIGLPIEDIVKRKPSLEVKAAEAGAKKEEKR